LLQKGIEGQVSELMRDAPDIERLRQMEQMDLAIEHAERCVAAVPNLSQKSAVPI
jgi:hypothetical protein